MKILIVAFEPFAGRSSNGSQAVGEELQRRFPRSVHLRVLPVTWAAVGTLQPRDVADYDYVIGLGEGFPHAVTVEQVALKRAAGPLDEAGQLPPKDLLRGGNRYGKVAVVRLWWRPPLDRRLSFPGTFLGHPTVVSSAFPGYQQCNALLWRLLTDLDARERSGFIHLPPRDGWMTAHPKGNYDAAFARVVIRILGGAYITLR